MPATFTDKIGTAEDTYTIPTTPGVDYLVDGVVKPAGTYPGTGTVWITTRAQPGYEIPYTLISSWTKTFNSSIQLISVVPKEPIFIDKDGTAEDTYTIPTTIGVDYFINGTVKAAGTYPAVNYMEINARAQAGYEIPSTAASTWKPYWSSYSWATEVSPKEPLFVDQDGTTEDTYTIPASSGVRYYVNGTLKETGTYPATGAVTVTAHAKVGYRIVYGATSSWGHTFTNYVPPITVRPAAATFIDEDGTTKDTYTIPSTEGVEYLVNGVVKPAGTYPGTGSITITYRAQPGYVVPDGYILRWGHTFTNYVPPITVRPAAATFIDEDGTTKDTYTIPSTEGVEYLVNGVVKPAGTYPGTGSITITARAKTDYVLADGADTIWNNTFAITMAASPAAPVFTDKPSTYTIPATTGVQYYVNGAATAPGTYKAKGTDTVEITARARDGYVLAEDATTSWKETFKKFPMHVTPGTVVFTDKEGAAADTYTIPDTQGVDYLVNGTVAAPGTYPGTGTVKIETKAQTGYVVNGPGTWKTTFKR
jgi:serine protease